MERTYGCLQIPTAGINGIELSLRQIKVIIEI